MVFDFTKPTTQNQSHPLGRPVCQTQHEYYFYYQENARAGKLQQFNLFLSMPWASFFFRLPPHLITWRPLRIVHQQRRPLNLGIVAVWTRERKHFVQSPVCEEGNAHCLKRNVVDAFWNIAGRLSLFGEVVGDDVLGRIIPGGRFNFDFASSLLSQTILRRDLALLIFRL